MLRFFCSKLTCGYTDNTNEFRRRGSNDEDPHRISECPSCVRQEVLCLDIRLVHEGQTNGVRRSIEKVFVYPRFQTKLGCSSQVVPFGLFATSIPGSFALVFPYILFCSLRSLLLPETAACTMMTPATTTTTTTTSRDPAFVFVSIHYAIAYLHSLSTA